MNLVYFVHDLNDPAVARRVLMLTAGGAKVGVAGFWRGDAPPEQLAGARVYPLGRTYDVRLAQRALSVVKSAIFPAPIAGLVRNADVIMARNLEMLALAARARAIANRSARLIYESLDIHRALLGDGAISRGLRRFERRLMASIDLLVTSSPAFLEHYFEARQGYRGPHRLVENKVLGLEPPSLGSAPRVVAVSPPQGPPWRIGWFGMLRCQRSLSILSALAATSGGRVEVVLRGRPARSAFSDFYGVVAKSPGLTFGGPYVAADLPELYGGVHFTWAIDYFEEGLNSSWLLPNRLYEGAFYGAPPVALAQVETGRWLARHGVGVTLDDPAKEAPSFFDTLSAEAYGQLRRKVSAIPRADLVADLEDCSRLVQALRGRGL